jgi:hypothetical protein
MQLGVSSVALSCRARKLVLQHRMLAAVALQKVDSADHSMNPLREAGVLQRVLGYWGPGHRLLMSLVSKDWRESYLQVPEQQLFVERDPCAEADSFEFTCETRMTLLKAAVASAALVKLARDCELPLDSSSLHFIVG